MKKFYLNEEEITEEEFKKQLEGCVTEYVDNNYDDLIDEDNEEYQIGYLTLRHIKEFLKQNGYDALTKKQILTEYKATDIFNKKIKKFFEK